MRLVVLVVALAVLNPLSAAALQSGPGVAQTGGNATTNASADVEPGARLAGVVGSQGARIDGEVKQRSFAVSLERANTTGAKAATVAAAVGRTNDTVSELRSQLDELRAAREAGNVSESTYRARVAVLAQRIASARELANRSAEAAADIPDAALRERGVSAAAARNVSRRAATLAGPEVAAIARNVTGRSNVRPAGPPTGVGRPDAGPPNRTAPGSGEPQTEETPGEGSAKNTTPAAGAPERNTGKNATADSGVAAEGDGNAPANGENTSEKDGNPSVEAGNASDGQPRAENGQNGSGGGHDTNTTGAPDPSENAEGRYS